MIKHENYYRLIVAKKHQTWFCQLEQKREIFQFNSYWTIRGSVEDESYLGLMKKVAEEGWIDKVNSNE